MKSKIIYRFKILVVISMVLFVSACDEEDSLDVPEQSKVEFDTSTEIGQRLQEIYEKYNVIIQYKWDRFAFNEFTITDPIKFDAILPVVDLVEILYFEPLSTRGRDNGFSKSFIHREAPLYFYLSGSGIYFENNKNTQREFGGTTAGIMEPHRLILGGLNYYSDILESSSSDDFFLSTIYEYANSIPMAGGLVGFLYHEYVHFLDKKYALSDKISFVSEDYVGNQWWAYTGPNFESFPIVNQKGFITSYGMRNKYEDLATFVQYIMWKDEAVLKNEYLLSDISIKKYELIIESFKGFGLDLTELRNYLYSDEVKAKLLELRSKYNSGVDTSSDDGLF